MCHSVENQDCTRSISDRLKEIPMSQGDRARAEIFLRAGASLADSIYRMSARAESLAALAEEGAGALLRRIRSAIAKPVRH